MTGGATGREPKPKALAWRRIGDFPPGVGKGLAREHAWMAWVNARSGVVARAEGLWASTDGAQSSFLGQVDLAFLGTLAGHLRRCEDCWKRWGDRQRPVDLLTKGVRKRPAGAVLGAVMTELKAQRALDAGTRGKR